MGQAGPRTTGRECQSHQRSLETQSVTGGWWEAGKASGGKEGKLNARWRTGMTGVTRPQQRCPCAGRPGQTGRSESRTDRALQLPTGHPNFRIHGPALGHAGIPVTHTGSALLVAPRGAALRPLTWASRAGRCASDGRRGWRREPAPHGPAPGRPGRRATPRFPALSAQLS